jgi:4a-hydroxytetrahydrobiopterin dehydratase
MSNQEENLDIPDGWKEVDGYLFRSISTKEYGQGVSYVFQVAKIAGELNHHPDITLTYSTVDIRTKSHDVDAITQRDVTLALEVNKVIEPPLG